MAAVAAAIREAVVSHEIAGEDDLIPTRFLYAFWRLCAQDTVELEDVPAGHSARILAERAGVSPEVRVATIRPTTPRIRRCERDSARLAAPLGGQDAQGSPVVPLRTAPQGDLPRPVHQGPADKPLLGGEV